MNRKQLNTISNNLVNAFTKKKIIEPIPIKFCKNIKNADLLRRTCESKIKWPIIGFKAGGTGISLLKKLKEKEPFYAAVYNKNFLKSGKKVKINGYKKAIITLKKGQNIDLTTGI